MLTTEQSALLAMIRSVLWDSEPPKRAEIAMGEAKKQALIPLLFPNSSEAMYYSVHYIRILHAQDELVALMRTMSIPMAILKGSAAACYYPEPFLRTMGDIDFIVPQERFQEASYLLEKNGYKITYDIDDSKRHRCFDRDGISFELHHHYSFDGIDVEQYVIAGLKRPMNIIIEGHEIPVLPDFENGMVLLAHAASHLRNGLGLRQVIDWMMFCNAVLDNELWSSQFQRATVECGLERFAVTLTRMCQKYLGLTERITWSSIADESLCDSLMDNIINTGNFGRSNGSGAHIETVKTNIRRYGLFRFLQIAGEHNWKAYHKYYWLKPFCWFYQIFRYARQGFKAGRNGAQLASDLTRADSRYDLLTRLGID